MTDLTLCRPPSSTTTTIESAKRRILREWQPPEDTGRFPATIHSVVLAIYDRDSESTDAFHRIPRYELAAETKLSYRATRYAVQALAAENLICCDHTDGIERAEINWPALLRTVPRASVLDMLSTCHESTARWLHACLDQFQQPLTVADCRAELLASTDLPQCPRYKGSLIAQKSALVWIDRIPGRPLSTADLAMRCGSSQRVAQKALKALDDAGYIRRCDSPLIVWSALFRDAPEESLARIELHADDDAKDWVSTLVAHAKCLERMGAAE